MSITEKLNEWFLPNQDDFKEKINDLKQKNLLLSDSTNHLKNLLETYSKDGLDGNEKEDLKEQIERHKELKELNDKFINSYDKLYENTKLSLKKYIKQLSNKNIKEGIIDNYSNNIDANLDSLKDTFLSNTPRDHIEKYIHFSNFLDNVIENDKISNFLEKFTIEYINILNKKYDVHYINHIIKNLDEGLHINEQELEYIILKIEPKFNEEITFNLFNKNKIENHKINPKYFIKEIENKYSAPIEVLELKENKEQINKTSEDTKNSNGNIKDIPYIKPNLKYTKINESKETNMNDIINILEKPIFLKLFDKYISTQINNNNKLDKNDKNDIINNLKYTLLLYVDIESDGKTLAKNNQGSSAKGLGQWLTNNGTYKIEYMKKGKFYDGGIINEDITVADWKEQNNKKEFAKVRKIRAPSSFEMTIKQIKKGYKKLNLGNDFNIIIEELLPKKISNYKNNNLNPLDYETQEQLLIFLLDIVTKANKELINCMLQGNEFCIKKFYTDKWHTDAKSKTLTRFKQKFNKYRKVIKYIG